MATIPEAVASSAAAATAVKGHTHPADPVLPRLDLAQYVAFGCLFLVTFLASLGLMPVSLHMLVAATATIYIGSRFALKCWRIEGGEDGSGVGEGEQKGRPGVGEQMATRDAMMFPILGSVVLFSLYLVYKFLPKEWVNVVIKAYFFLFGCLVLAQKLAQLATATLPEPLVRQALKSEYSVLNPMWAWEKGEKALEPVLKRIPFLGYGQTAPAKSTASSSEHHHHHHYEPATFWLTLSLLDCGAVAAALLVSILYIMTNSWICSNVFGIAFSIQGIELLSLGSYLNGAILLCGLFLYDIFWVFGTEVMVSVAKSFDAPIKLLFPPTIFASTGSHASMLGLGDIVIPGIFVALLLRWDIWREVQRIRKLVKDEGRTLSKEEEHCIDCLYCHVMSSSSSALSSSAAASSSKKQRTSSERFVPLYFRTNLVAYAMGLGVTIGVMYIFKAAQPALLYLVPACLGTSAVQAVLRGEWKELWKYAENEEEEETETDAQTQQKEKKEVKKDDDETTTVPTNKANGEPTPVSSTDAEPEVVSPRRSSSRRSSRAEPSSASSDKDDGTGLTRRTRRGSSATRSSTSSKKKKRSARAE